MKIEIKQITPWSRALDAARWTVNKDLTGKEPSDAWKSKMLIAEHSPIRLVEYDIFIKDDNVYIIKQGKEISLYVTN